MLRQEKKTLAYLSNKRKILFITSSNRWSGEKGGEQPKSTELAYFLKANLPTKEVDIIDIPSLIIHPCEGNVSTRSGNTCGVRGALLENKEQNPSGQHRCWASINNTDDELWKVSKALLEADAVVFFGSVRWGQMNAMYQKLIERLTWLENRHTTLGETNILKAIDAGIIVTGHNWRGNDVVAVQKKVLSFFGFNVVSHLCWHWQFTSQKDESGDSYKKAGETFRDTLLV